jgi:hypothetical protein
MITRWNDLNERWMNDDFTKVRGVFVHAQRLVEEQMIRPESA